MAPRRNKWQQPPAASNHGMKTRARGSASPERPLPPRKPRETKSGGTAGVKKNATNKTKGAKGRKGKGGGISDEPSQPTDQPPAEDTEETRRSRKFSLINRDPCRFARNLRSAMRQRVREANIQTTTVNEGELLHDDNLLLAIASVQEAVNNLMTDGVHTFSLMDVGTWSGLRYTDLAGARALRPRCTLLLPWIVSAKEYVDLKSVEKRKKQLDAASHYFLVEVFIPGPNTEANPLSLPRLRIYDSSRDLFDEGMRFEVLMDICRYIERSQWYYGPGVNQRIRFAHDVQLVDVAQQSDGVSCGIHTILNAWIIATGLTLANPQPQQMNDEFNAEATELINLALNGNLNFWTLYAFLRFHGLVEEVTSLASSPKVRIFPTTVAMVNRDTLVGLYQTQKEIEETAMLRATPITQPGERPPEENWQAASVDNMRAYLMALDVTVPDNLEDLRTLYYYWQMVERDGEGEFETDSFIEEVFAESEFFQGFVTQNDNPIERRGTYLQAKARLTAEIATVKERRANAEEAAAAANDED